MPAPPEAKRLEGQKPSMRRNQPKKLNKPKEPYEPGRRSSVIGPPEDFVVDRANPRGLCCKILKKSLARWNIAIRCIP